MSPRLRWQPLHVPPTGAAADNPAPATAVQVGEAGSTSPATGPAAQAAGMGGHSSPRPHPAVGDTVEIATLRYRVTALHTVDEGTLLALHDGRRPRFVMAHE